MAGGSLSPIYNHMNGVAPYHPFEADTYADWSLEAGDIVTVSRGGTSYSSPVHSTSLVWRGQPEMHISSTGKEKRDPISKVSMKKYASRGGGMWNDQSLYWELYSDDGQFHSVLEATSSRLSAKMEDFYNGLFSYIEFTASRLYTEFMGLYDGLSSHFEITRSRMYADFMGLYDGLKSEFEITRSRMYVDFMGLYDGLKSEFEVTRSRMYADFMGLYDGLTSSFEVTRSRLYVDFRGMYDGLSSNFEVTRSRMRVEFHGLYDGLSSSFEVTRSRMRAEFYGLYDGLSSNFEVTRSRMRAEFYGLYDGLSSNFEVTRSRMRAEFYGLYDGLNSTFEVTRSRMYVDFEGLYDGLNSSFEVTRSRMRAEFTGLYDGLKSSFEVTRSRMYVDFSDFYDGLSSTFEVTRSRMYVAFNDAYNGLSSEFIRTASNWTSQFNNTYTNLSSRIDQEAGKISLIVEGTGSNAHIKPAAIQAGINAATGQSKIQLSADHIQLDGDVVASALTVDDPITVASVNAQAAKSYFYDFQFEDPITGEGPYNSGEILVSAYVDNNNTLHILNAAGDETTFSKAASVTALTGSWSGGTLTVSTVPASGHTFVNTPSLAFNGNGTQSFSAEMSAVDSTGTNAVRNSLYGYLELTGSGSSLSVVARTDSGSFASLSVGSLLTTKSISANGTYTPDSGYIGFSSVTVNVPGINNAKARFNVASGAYYIEAYDNTSGESISGSGVTYKLAVSGSKTAAKVQVQNPSNVRISDTPELPIGSIYTEGWEDAFGKMALPDASTSRTSITVYYPNSTAGTSTPNSVTYDLDVDSSYVYLKEHASGATVARKTNSGGSANTKARFNSASGSYYIEAYNSSTGTAISGSSFTYQLVLSGNVVYIRNSSGGAVNNTATCNVTSRYIAGWNDAYGSISWPTYDTDETFYVGYPNPTPGESALSRRFVISKGSTPGTSGYASVTLMPASGSGNGTLVGRIQIGDWYSAGVAYGTSTALSTVRTRFMSNSSGYYIEAYDGTTGNSVSGSSVNYQIKGIYDSSRGGGYIQIHDKSSPSARIANTYETNVWLVTANQKNHQGTLAYDTVYGITVGNDIIATWKTPEATSHSVSLSVDMKWTGSVSGYESKGSYSASELAQTYIRISASCGGSTKKWYYTIN